MTKRTSRRPFDGNVIVGGRNEGRTHKRRFLTWKIGGGAGLFGGEIKRKKEVQKEKGTTKKKKKERKERGPPVRHCRQLFLSWRQIEPKLTKKRTILLIDKRQSSYCRSLLKKELRLHSVLDTLK